jgi:flagellin-like protein
LELKKMMKVRKAVSPVIATVILVAVAITVSVGVSYWMGGITSQYTQFEKVEVQTGYSTNGVSGWTITLELKNSGSAPATLTRVFVNDVPITEANYGKAVETFVAGAVTASISYAGTSLTSGASTTQYLYISSTYAGLSSGTTVNIKIHSAGGMDYIKLIQLA